VGGAEVVLLLFLVGDVVVEFVVCDECSSDAEPDADSHKDQHVSSGVILWKGGQVGGLGWCQGDVGEDFHAAYEIRYRECEPSSAGALVAGDVDGRGDGPECDVRLGVDDVELERGAGERINAAAAAGDVGDGCYVVELEDEVGLRGAGDELIVAPGLEGRVDVVVGLGFVDGEVGVGAGVGEEDRVGCGDLCGHGCIW